MIQITFCPKIQEEEPLKWPQNLNRLGYAAQILGIFYFH